MIKFKVHKGCSCRSCRRGKNKIFRKIHERKLRAHTKQLLNKLGEDFSNYPKTCGYSD